MAGDDKASAAGDEEVIAEVLKGNVDTFAVLLVRYKSHVGGVVAAHVPPDQVEEVSQTTFVKAFQSLNSFAGRGSFKSWLTSIALKASYDFWRQRYRRQEISLADLSDRQEEWLNAAVSNRSEKAFYRLASRNEATEVLGWALSRLSAEDRMVITMIHLDDHSIKETAKLLGWTIANVKIRSFRARKKMRELIGRLLDR